MSCKRCGGRLTGRRNRVYCSRECQEKRGVSDPVSRFWAKVQKTDTCWLWMGHLNEDGYGKFGVKSSESYLAHRYSYQLAFGAASQYVLHTCDNPACVNPDHLFTGSQADNMRDASAKGRLAGRSIGEKHPRAKLTAGMVREIRAQHQSGTVSGADMARRYGVTKEAIYAVLQRKTWGHLADE
jgi:hypothetical protein